MFNHPNFICNFLFLKSMMVKNDKNAEKKKANIAIASPFAGLESQSTIKSYILSALIANILENIPLKNKNILCFL